MGWRFRRRKRHPTAVKTPLPQGIDHIAADRTDIPLTAQQIAGPIGVGPVLPGQQFRHRDPQGLGQGLQQREVRQALSGIP